MSLDKLGKDEWVSQIGQRRRQQNPVLAALIEQWTRLPRLGQIALLAVVPLLLPLVLHNDYVIHVAGLIWLYGSLALGLNVVVGYAGLLDLGYVAFFGVGAYGYAMLSSPQFGIHWPTLLSVPVMTLLAAGVGFVLALPSLRLQGDYLAIVTLGFGQIFVQLTTAMNRVTVPWATDPINVTGGPNGVVNVDRLSILSLSAQSETAYYYILLATMALLVVMIYRLNQSRLGRAWRSIREDTLAAEAMGIPTDRLRLLAFAIGAGVAGFCGAVFAAWQQSVFPGNFDVTLLITLYAMVVLGGVGSLPGMVAGSVIINAIPEVLRNGNQFYGIELAQIVFYGGVLVCLVLLLRPRRQVIFILAAVAALGILIHVLAFDLAPDYWATPQTTTSALSNVIGQWLVIPLNVVNKTGLGNLAFYIVVALLVLVRRVPKNLRSATVVVILYLLAFVWETRLSQDPSTTNLILTGAMLVLLMTYRPQGLFGQRRVEIV